jgi:hypothetical protein
MAGGCFCVFGAEVVDERSGRQLEVLTVPFFSPYDDTVWLSESVFDEDAFGFNAETA